MKAPELTELEWAALLDAALWYPQFRPAKLCAAAESAIRKIQAARINRAGPPEQGAA